MDAAGDTPYDIHQKCGIQPSTTYRFLAGGGEPKPDTVKKWARAYRVTESQLRGDAPIEGMQMPVESPELKDLMTLDEYRLHTNMKKLSTEARSILHRLASMLAEEPQSANPEAILQRRVEHVYPNGERRSGERHYRPPHSKRRIKDDPDGRQKHARTS